jgi:hypothetical protein
MPIEPVAPGSLWSHPTKGSSLFNVHRVWARDQLSFVFETFGAEADNPPEQGSIVYFQSHWLPLAMEAVLDTSVSWERRVYPDNGDHDHCTFTWETIASYAENKSGYWSKKYHWITERAYRDFIINDIYHLRSLGGA